MKKIIKMFSNFYKRSTSPRTPLGRWALKHNCKSEDIVVHQTNRDHCGDVICGKPLAYKKYTDSQTKN